MHRSRRCKVALHCGCAYREISFPPRTRLNVLHSSADSASDHRRHPARRQRPAGHADRACAARRKAFRRRPSASWAPSISSASCSAALPSRRIMSAVGHVRSFSALAAIASAGTLLLVLVIDPVAVVGDPLRHRLLLRRPVHDHGKLAEFRCLQSRPCARAGALPHHRHRFGHRRAVHDPDLRCRRLHASSPSCRS